MTVAPAIPGTWSHRREIGLSLASAVGVASGVARCGFRLDPAENAVALWILAAAVLLVAACAVHRWVEALSRRTAIEAALFAAVAALFAAGLAAPSTWAGRAVGGVRLDLVLPVALAVLGLRETARRAGLWLQRRIREGMGSPVTPPQLWVLSFVAAILLGAAALALPRSRPEGSPPIGFVDALFTSTSAVCVTGLATFDVGSRLSIGGQGVLLALIQLGGLGMMTYAAFFSLLFGQGLGPTQQAVMREMVTSRFAAKLGKAVLAIAGLTLLFEAIGAGVLYLAGVESTGGRAWAATFHSVSAFCNAGFALWPSNMMSFERRPLVLGAIAFLVVAGGLGFAVLIDLARWAARRRVGDLPPRFSRLSLHTRVVVVSTGALLVVGAVGFLAFEWNGVLAGYGFGHKVSHAVFHSAMTRTAGFNAIDMGQVGTPCLLMTMGLMFVGASPASTGGGIKTTTLVVLIAAIRALATNHESAHVLGRSLPDRVVKTALVLFALGASAVFAGTLALTVLEPDLPPLGLAFEAVSALCTVGLSTGVTPQLCAASKLVLCVLMLVGRVGPVTLLFSMAGAAQPARYQYAEEDILVG